MIKIVKIFACGALNGVQKKHKNKSKTMLGGEPKTAVCVRAPQAKFEHFRFSLLQAPQAKILRFYHLQRKFLSLPLPANSPRVATLPEARPRG
jgi:hypothetical protein